MLVTLKIEGQTKAHTVSQTWLRDGQSLTVGRSYGEMVVAHDPAMARAHFEVSCDGREAWVRDLASPSGTWLNDQQVERAALRAGDRIRAGQTTFVVMISGQPVTEDSTPRKIVQSPEATPAADAPAAPRRRRPAVRVLNETPFVFGLIPGRVHWPEHSVTVVVKGTFQLGDGEIALVADEQLPVGGDIPYPDDEEGHSAPRYPSDLAPFKPRADLLLVGHCHAPKGEPVRQCSVTFRVGRKSQTLMVFGKRYWEGILALQPTEPRRFRKMQLRYEFAYGGPGHRANPRGKGLVRIEATGGKTKIPLPEIEDARDLMSRPAHRATPAGFGPLRWSWDPRHQALGTYDKAWLAERWPWFPRDFVWSHFNTAPTALQLDGYLRGDEELYLANLRPDRTEYRATLPGLKARAFVERTSGAFEEVLLALDTLWVDADEQKLVLVWRGVVPVATGEFGDLKHVLLTSESLTQPLAAPEALLRARLAELEPIMPPRPQPARDTVPKPNPAAERAAARAEIARVLADARAQIQKAGLDPAKLAPLPGPAKEVFEELLKELGLSPDGREAPAPFWTREMVKVHAAAKGSFAGERLSGLDLSGLVFAGLDFAGADLIGTRLVGAKLAKADLSGANLINADLSGADLARANLHAAQLVAANLTRTFFEEADLSEAALSAVQGREAHLVRAKLGRADLTSAELPRADFSAANLAEANLSAANLSGAVLREADATKANLSSARLGRAQLAGAIFANANLRGAVLTKVSGPEALFVEANLRGAQADGGEFERADFSRAQLAEGSFREARLTQATLHGVQAAKADFSGATLVRARLSLDADFTAAKLAGIDAGGSAWADALLDRADFSQANLDGAVFAGASCRETIFELATLKRAKFQKAQLVGANLQRANLFEAGFHEANLEGADVSEANLYGASLMGARIENLRREKTNVRGTLLALGGS